jgi:mono/diheme cytochrome c family protein
MHFVRVACAPAVLALTALAAGVIGQGAVLAASVETGKAAYIKHGCWQCHGFEGQGSVASSGGKVIADTKLPLEAFISFVRTTSGAMPPYRQEILSDSDLADIYAYLQSLPRPKSASDIPLLGEVR